MSEAVDAIIMFLLMCVGFPALTSLIAWIAYKVFKNQWYAVTLACVTMLVTIVAILFKITNEIKETVMFGPIAALPILIPVAYLLLRRYWNRHVYLKTAAAAVLIDGAAIGGVMLVDKFITSR